jgi:hypothetical protein
MVSEAVQQHGAATETQNSEEIMLAPVSLSDEICIRNIN